jgi:hypothetical protein
MKIVFIFHTIEYAKIAKIEHFLCISVYRRGKHFVLCTHERTLFVCSSGVENFPKELINV